MARRKLTSYFLYRRRGLLAYIFIFSALALLLAIALLIPGGLTTNEQLSSVQAMNDTIVRVNAPYYLLQKGSISLLGLSTLSIKLPSLALGAILGITLFLLLRRWLTLGIAVFGSLIIFSSVTFLSLAGTGSPAILYVLFPVLLLFFGTRVLAHDSGLILFAMLSLITVGLALLTPTMVYLVILVLILAIFNPHVRYGVRRLPVTGRLLLGLGFIISLTPLTYLVMTEPSSLQQIFAVPESVTLTTLGSNISTLHSLFLDFLHPGLAADMPAPLIGLAVFGLAILGLYRMIRAIYTARAQFILGWSVIALFLAIIDHGFGILLFLPIILLASLGLSHLAAIWYRTFPLNPYARVSALLPIGILIGGIVLGSSMRYINTTLYADGAAELYSHDLQILQRYLHTATPSKVVVAVPEQQVSFYSSLRSPSISDVVPLSNAASMNGPLITTQAQDAKTPIRILTDGRADHADRFYVYQ